MECLRATLVVITLLQLCRAEQIIPQWYSANINSGFQPKPISEIFSTDPVFSTSKPIVVSQKNSNSMSDEIDVFSSTLSPPISSSETTKMIQQTLSTTTAMPAGALYQQIQLGQFDPQQVNILPQQPNYLQPNVPSYVPPVQLIPISQEPQLQQVTDNPPEVTSKVNVQPLAETKQTFTPGLPLTTLFQPQTQTTLFQPQTQTTGFQTQTQTQKPTSIGTQPPTLAVTTPLPSLAFRPPNSNYFLIYQQAPQSIQSFPPSSPSAPGISEVTIRASTPTTVSLPPRTTEFSTTRAFPITSISTTPLPTTFLSTPAPTIGASTLSSSSVTVTPSSTLGLTSGCIRSSTPIPVLLNGLNKKASGLAFPLKIRVIAPTGSITNVNINPLTTTKRPATKSTTKRPTTKRTSKPKKNNYDRCLDGCRKVKDPICAAPLSHVTIDPKKLRGFPSVCHMACHNSYRKDPFEKVIDGSCSKLRTRIRLIDSKSKLKKDELRKNEYTLDIGDKTVIELTGVA